MEALQIPTLQQQEEIINRKLKMKNHILLLLLLSLSTGSFAQVQVPIFTMSSGGGATGNVHPSTSIPTNFGSIGQPMVMPRNSKTDNGGGVMVAANLIFTNSIVAAPVPTSQPTALTFANVTATSFKVSFTAATPAPAGYLVLRKAGSTITATPSVGVAYALNSTLSDATVAYVGSATTFDETGLTPGTSYFYFVFSFNGSGSLSNYLVTSPLAGNKITFAAEPTVQPAAITFTTVTTTSFTVSFTNASPLPAGYIAIRKVGSAPVSTPVDGTTYTLGGTLGDGTVVSFSNAISFAETGLTPFTTYYYAVYSYNGVTGTYNYLTTSPASNSQQTKSADTTPPEVTSATAASIASKTSLVVKATVVENESNIDSVSLHYRSVAADKAVKFKYEPMTLTSGVWQFTIPDTEIKELGAEYTITAINSVGLKKTINGNTTINIENADHFLPYTSFGALTPNYKIISIPIALQDKTVTGVFQDDLGPYDNTRWRMYHYEAPNSNELNGSSVLELGKGYWLIIKEDPKAPIDIGAGTTAPVSSDKPFTISLVTGWNQIGNPYLFNILWSDVVAASGNAALKLKTYGTDWVTTSTKLNKFEGGFVQVSAPTLLTFPVAKNLAAGRTEEAIEIKKLNPLDDQDWELRFNLVNGNRKNEFGGVGMNPTAKEGYDVFDDFTLPRLFDYVELNHHKKAYGMTYTKDIIPTVENSEWQFTVESNIEATTSMTWDNSYFGKNDKHIVLWDVEEKRSVDMREANQYSFKGNVAKTFHVFFGNKEYVQEKTALKALIIHSLSPNPTDGETKIAFTLAGTEESFVQVKVMSLLGQSISTAFEGYLAGGLHEVTWSGKDSQGNKPAQGVYLVEIIQGKERGSKRLIVK